MMMNNARMLSFKEAAISAAVVSTSAVIVSLAGPPVAGFLTAEIPRVYGVLVAWMAPPYLYIVVNFIILSIAVSSRFQRVHGGGEEAHLAAVPVVRPIVVDPATYKTEYDGKFEADVLALQRITPEIVSPLPEILLPAPEIVLPEKPLVLERIGNRRSLKVGSEGKALRRVSTRPKRNETLESTWRTITEGRAVPLARHFKNSNTFTPTPELASPETPKSENFNTARSPETVATPAIAIGGGVARLRREPSLGQDELNRRVEAFINKFNEEMRIQREESLKRRQSMMMMMENRGSN